MKRRIISLCVVLGMLLSNSAVYSMAKENTDVDEHQDENGARSVSYDAIIMQGDTYSDSDCLAL